MTDSLIILDETGRWRGRGVRCLEGRWDRLVSEIPVFTTEEFRAQGEAPPNPYVRSVVRLPRTTMEWPVPVGVVSKKYTLVQHAEVREKCLEGIRLAGIETPDLRCEVGLTELGEWMNLRIYFPPQYNHSGADGKGSRPAAGVLQFRRWIKPACARLAPIRVCERNGHRENDR